MTAFLLAVMLEPLFGNLRGIESHAFVQIIGNTPQRHHTAIIKVLASVAHINGIITHHRARSWSMRSYGVGFSRAIAFRLLCEFAIFLKRISRGVSPSLSLALVSAPTLTNSLITVMLSSSRAATK